MMAGTAVASGRSIQGGGLSSNSTKPATPAVAVSKISHGLASTDGSRAYPARENLPAVKNQGVSSILPRWAGAEMLDAIAERVAIIIEAGDVSEAAAHRLAGAEAAESIHAELAMLPPACSPTGHRLIECTRRFLASDWWSIALTAGWELPEIFGCDPWAPLVRVEHAGIATSAAICPIKGLRLVEITSERAVFSTSRGDRLTDTRTTARRTRAIVWWRCPALIGEAIEADDHCEVAA